MAAILIVELLHPRADGAKALDRFKRRIREITRQAKGVTIQRTIQELAS